jgi:carbamoyl-phosphate synthase large subunit
MKKIPILITAIGGGGHGEQILKAILLSNRKHYFIVGADVNPYCSQFSLVDQSIQLPYATDPNYLDVLLKYCHEYNIKTLFHGCEPELKIFAQKRDVIEKQGIFLPVNPLSVINTCMDKIKTNQILQKLGFDPPKMVKVFKKDSIKEIDWFPVVVKPSLNSGGSANVFIAQNLKELSALSDYLGLEENSNSFFIQEYVGTPDLEYTVGVLHDMNGNYLNSIAVKRLLSGQLNVRMSVENRTKRNDLGKELVISSGISHGYVGRFPEVTEKCSEIARAIGVRGPVNIQCRLVGKKVKVFEINPRFSGTTSLRAMVGYNEPDVLIRKHLLNDSSIKPNFKYNSALILRKLVEVVV